MLAAMAALSPAPALAWGDEGHQIIALVAYAHLTPAAREKVDAIPHPKLRRHQVELFGAQFADRMQGTAATRAIPVLNVDDHLVARQVRRERAMVATRLFGARLARRAERGGAVLGRLVGGDRLLQFSSPSWS